MPKDNEVFGLTRYFNIFICMVFVLVILASVCSCLLVACVTTGVLCGQSCGYIKEIFTFSGCIYRCWLANFESTPIIYVLFILWVSIRVHLYYVPCTTEFWPFLPGLSISSSLNVKSKPVVTPGFLRYTGNFSPPPHLHVEWHSLYILLSWQLMAMLLMMLQHMISEVSWLPMILYFQELQLIVLHTFLQFCVDFV